MDHLPFILAQDTNSEGFHLHGGSIDCATGEYSPAVAYSCVQNRIYTPLLAVSVALVDVKQGDGGFVVVPGSHKANFPTPSSMIHGEDMREHVQQPTLSAGDVLLFSEGTVHGARPWLAEHQRRMALYRYYTTSTTTHTTTHTTISTTISTTPLTLCLCGICL
jgi:ectoine hydroxylase-related dioxygenase (phytanoyl-CoA dioxygenase family)